MIGHSLQKLRLPAFLLVIGLLIVLGLAPSAGAQYYFGKNKVQYTQFDWQVMTTEHFRIYFYTAETEVARIAARIAEDSYDSLRVKFNHEVRRSIPLIIYSSPLYFSQTNVIPSLLPEAVGGFTEFMKGRVVLPFHGSYHDFEHVLRHELVHVFTLSKLDAVVDRHSRIRFTYPPLWFTEGLAEHWSTEWDTEADMIVKDMVISGRLIPIPNLYVVSGTFFMYKLGQSICGFIEEYYGRDKLLRIFENWPKADNFDEIVKITLGDNLAEVSRKWEYHLKKTYFPEIKNLGLPKMESQQVTRQGYSETGVPITWDDGHGKSDWIVFKANRMGYSGIYMKPAGSLGGSVKTLLKGERSGKFESLYLLRSGIDANDAGKIVFSAKSNETDIINIYDLNEGGVRQRYHLENLVAARSPRLSPDGRQVVFTGIKKDGFADLYLLQLSTGDFTQVTDDIYNDADPSFTPDGTHIVFSSDRGAYGPEGALNLYRIDIASGELTQLTFGNYTDQTPDATPNGIYFSSNRGGTYNLYLLDSNGTLTRQSIYVTGALSPRLASDGSKLVYTGYQDQSYQIYEMELPEEPETVEQPFAVIDSPWKPAVINRKFSQASVKYENDYSLDIAQSSIAYDPVYGTMGGVQLAMSDVLGNNAFHFLLTNTAESSSELLTSFNFGVTYINKKDRLNWGLGAYHLYDEYYNDYDLYYNERQAGVISLFSYPFSKFHRVEFTTLARYSKKDRRYGLVDREGFLVTNYVRWVYDNSLWDITGPIEGRRYNITLGLTSSLSEGRNYNRIVLADFRHYFRLGRFSAFANRLFGYHSSGLDPQRIYFGGSWSFRGFSRREFYNRNVVFASNELRFPLIDDLLIGFPFGGFGLRGIRGAVFFDVGSAWDDHFDQLLGSFGTGIRVALGYFVVLRFDFSRTTDFKTVSPKTDFDFFFGWNF